jgi:hypothetical protein
MEAFSVLIMTSRRGTIAGLLLTLGLIAGCQLGMESALPDCSVSPSSLDFGAVSLGGDAYRSFSIENLGTGSLNGSVSEDSPYYSIFSGGGDFSLGEGQSLLVRVRFAPTSGGPLTCSVDLGTGRCSSVPCTGIGGTGPICEVNPDSLNFGSVPVGSFFDRGFSIRNIGDGILTGLVSEDDPEYSIVMGAGVFNLAREEVLTVGVRFEPTSVGLKRATILTGTECGTIPCEGVGARGTN